MSPPRLDGASALRVSLMVGDALALVLFYAIPLMLLADVRSHSVPRLLAETSLVAAAGVAAVRQQGLWCQRIRSVRILELSRIPRVFVLLSVVVAVIDRKAVMNVRAWQLGVAAVIGTVGFVGWRSAHRAVLTSRRRWGRLGTDVLLVGSGRRAAELRQLFAHQPELGYHVVGLVGRRDDLSGTKAEGMWLGDLDQAPELIERVDADLVIVCTSDLDDRLVHRLMRAVTENRRALLVDAGLPGVDFRRVRPTAVAHEAFLELDQPSLPMLERALKRVFDIAVAGLMLALLAPVGALIAVLIKLDDRGPVFFRQRRVGRYGSTFDMIKFRTMAVDAEARLAELKARNERVGPLFKMDDKVDPRITKIGRVLRAFSLDELPQLLNVLRGEMSLVGPRPALPSEVVEFPAELLARHDVRPGITGLWQVDARDNKEFAVYRRLDLFYVENWSIALDLMIVVSTADHLLFRPLLARIARRSDASVTDAAQAAGDVVPAA